VKCGQNVIFWIPMERNRDFVTEMPAQMSFTFNFGPFRGFSGRSEV
jgi:hypothetical protein